MYIMSKIRNQTFQASWLIIRVPQELFVCIWVNYIAPPHVIQVHTKYGKSSVLNAEMVQYASAAMRAVHINFALEL